MSHIDLRARPGLRAGPGEVARPAVDCTHTDRLCRCADSLDGTVVRDASPALHREPLADRVGWIRYRPRTRARLDGRNGGAAIAVCRGDGDDHGDAPLLRRVVRCSHVAGYLRHRSGGRFRGLRGASAGRVVLLDGTEPRSRGRSRAAVPTSRRLHNPRQPTGRTQRKRPMRSTPLAPAITGRSRSSMKTKIRGQAQAGANAQAREGCPGRELLGHQVAGLSYALSRALSPLQIESEVTDASPLAVRISLARWGGKSPFSITPGVDENRSATAIGLEEQARLSRRSFLAKRPSPMARAWRAFANLQRLSIDRRLAEAALIGVQCECRAPARARISNAILSPRRVRRTC
jgi:hypothetical protein